MTEPILRINTRQYGVTEEDIAAFFDGCEIKQMFISKLGQFAFVEFTDEENVAKAMEKNGEKLKKQKTKMFRQDATKWAKLEAVAAAEESIAQEPASAESHLVVLKFLKHDTTVEAINEIFEELDVLHVHLIHDSYKRKGALAILEFAAEEDQKKALEKNKTVVDGRSLKVEALEHEVLVRVLDSLNAEVDPDYILIKVMGMSFQATQEDIDELFEGVEEEERFVPKSLEGESVGIIFAAFSSKVDAAELILKHRQWVCNRPVSMIRGHADELRALTAGCIVTGRRVLQSNNRNNNTRFNIKRRRDGGGRRGRGGRWQRPQKTITREDLDAEMDSYKKSGAGGAEGSTS